MSHANQEWLEEQYSRKHVHRIILNDIKANPEYFSKLRLGEDIVTRWAYEACAYESKQVRKNALIERYRDEDDHLDFMPLVERVVATIVRSEYTTINNIAMMLLDIGHNLEGRQALDLACEVIAMLADTDLYDLRKPYIEIMVISRVTLSDNVKNHVDQTGYIPPLIVKPKAVTKNWDTPYYSYAGESLILGSKHNHHDKNICLDVINIQNRVALSLSMEFMAVYEEPEPDHQEKAKENGKTLSPQGLIMAQNNWKRYQKQCKFFALLLDRFGNRIYLGNRVDKRGRMYCSGYHVSPQGNSYRKAIVELANTEMVEVPSQYLNQTL